MFKHLFGAKIGIIPYYIYRKLFENIQLCTKSPPDSASLRGIFFLRAYARCSSECRYYRSCDTCNDLHDELNGFLLTHGWLGY